jgi:hypothetical protein
MAIKTAEVRLLAGEGIKFVGHELAKFQSEYVFFGTVDREDQLVSTSIARKESTSLDLNDGPTDELLFTVTVRVDTPVASSTVGQLTIEGMRFKDGNEALLDLQSAGAVLGRDGLVFGPGNVHIVENRQVGIFGYAQDGNAELLNTAVLNSQEVRAELRVLVVHLQGAPSTISPSQVNECWCASNNNAVLNAGDCAAVLDGTETSGSQQVMVRVSCIGFNATIPFRVHYPSSVTISSSLQLLRPIAGWYDEAHSDCSKLHYQSAILRATASFSDMVGAEPDYADFDVTAITTFYSSGSNKVVSISNGNVVTAVAAGLASIVVRPTPDGKVWASTSVEVAPMTAKHMLGIVGIDAQTYSELGAVTLDSPSPYQRGEVIGVSMAPPVKFPLRFEGDSLLVVASAVFDDHTRIQLTPENGLHIVSFRTDALVLSEDYPRQVVVPHDPMRSSGPILEVSWAPRGPCFTSGPGLSGSISSEIVVDVTPPMADALHVASSFSLLACKGDPASALGVGLPAVAQLSVSLDFGSKVQSNLEHDPRTHFEVTPGAPFTVGNNGTVVANSDGAVGSGGITITFVGQNVTGYVAIEVTKMVALQVYASPEPAFPSSSTVVVSTLSSIACTVPSIFQQAKLYAVVQLANSQYIRVDANYVTYIVAADKYLGLDQENQVVTGVEPGIANVVGIFYVAESGKSYKSAPLSITVNGGSVAVKAIDDFHLANSQGLRVTSLAGGVGLAIAQLQFETKLTDDRIFPETFSLLGTAALAGLFGFESSHPNVLHVDANRGTAILLDNHHELVTLKVAACPGEGIRPATESATLEVACNLEPTRVGDVDLGEQAGVPVPSPTVGKTIMIPVRINTGNKFLAAFNIRIQFDQEFLRPELSLIATTVSPKKGMVEMKSSVSEDGNEIVIAGVIQSSKVRGTSKGVAVLELAFTTLKPGLTAMTGVAVELLDTTAGTPQNIGTPGSVFTAGNIAILIRGLGRRSRRHQHKLTAATSIDTVHSIQRSFLATWHRLKADAAAAQHQRTRRGDFSILQGDANCDGKISLEDPIRINNYIAARNGNFETALGVQIQDLLVTCRANYGLANTDVSFLDIDGNNVVEGIDSTYFLDVMVQNFYFADIRIAEATMPSCTFAVQISLSNTEGTLPRAGTQVLLDIGYLQADLPLASALASSPQHITSDKGDSTLQGSLLALVASAMAPNIFEFSFPTPRSNLSSIGISVIQVANKNMEVSPRWKFFAGPEANPKFDGALEYGAATLNTERALQRSGGYNPLVRNVVLASTDCRYELATTVSTQTVSERPITKTSRTETLTTSTIPVTEPSATATQPSATKLHISTYTAETSNSSTTHSTSATETTKTTIIADTSSTASETSAMIIMDTSTTTVTTTSATRTVTSTIAVETSTMLGNTAATVVGGTFTSTSSMTQTSTTKSSTRMTTKTLEVTRDLSQWVLDFLSVPPTIPHDSNDIAIALEFVSSYQANVFEVSVLADDGYVLGSITLDVPLPTGVQLVFVPLSAAFKPNSNLQIRARLVAEDRKNGQERFDWATHNDVEATYRWIQVGPDLRSQTATIKMAFATERPLATWPSKERIRFLARIQDEIVGGPLLLGLDADDIVSVALSDTSDHDGILAEVLVQNPPDDLERKTTQLSANIRSCDFCLVFDGNLYCPNAIGSLPCGHPIQCSADTCPVARVCKPIPATNEFECACNVTFGASMCSQSLNMTDTVSDGDSESDSKMNGSKDNSTSIELRDITIIIVVVCLVIVSTILLIRHYCYSCGSRKRAGAQTLQGLNDSFPSYFVGARPVELEWEEGIWNTPGKQSATRLAMDSDFDPTTPFSDRRSTNQSLYRKRPPVYGNTRSASNLLQFERQTGSVSSRSSLSSARMQRMVATNKTLKGWHSQDLRDMERGSDVGSEGMVWDMDGDSDHEHDSSHSDDSNASELTNLQMTHFHQSPQGYGEQEGAFDPEDTEFLDPNDMPNEVPENIATEIPDGDEMDKVYHQERIAQLDDHGDRVDAVCDLADAERRRQSHEHHGGSDNNWIGDVAVTKSSPVSQEGYAMIDGTMHNPSFTQSKFVGGRDSSNTEATARTARLDDVTGTDRTDSTYEVPSAVLSRTNRIDSVMVFPDGATESLPANEAVYETAGSRWILDSPEPAYQVASQLPGDNGFESTYQVTSQFPGDTVYEMATTSNDGHGYGSLMFDPTYDQAMPAGSLASDTNFPTYDQAMPAGSLASNTTYQVASMARDSFSVDDTRQSFAEDAGMTRRSFALDTEARYAKASRDMMLTSSLVTGLAQSGRQLSMQARSAKRHNMNGSNPYSDDSFDEDDFQNESYEKINGETTSDTTSVSSPATAWGLSADGVYAPATTSHLRDSRAASTIQVAEVNGNIGGGIDATYSEVAESHYGEIEITTEGNTVYDEIAGNATFGSRSYMPTSSSSGDTIIARSTDHTRMAQGISGMKHEQSSGTAALSGVSSEYKRTHTDPNSILSRFGTGQALRSVAPPPAGGGVGLVPTLPPMQAGRAKMLTPDKTDRLGDDHT